MPTFADIYASCLYASGEGLPLWNPSPLRLGDIGFVRDGSFIVLYNAIDGPEALSDAASIPLARRSDRSISSDRVRHDSALNNMMDIDTPADAAATATVSSKASSLPTSSIDSSSTVLSMSNSAASDSLLPSATSKPSPILATRKLRSGTPPERPYPPMPLSVDHEAPQMFDMGPRMSSNYRCLGLDVGASIPGAPVNVKIGFESAGGDGAILIPRDPTERTRLKYLGVLKAYIKAHHKWMYDTYGRIEAINMDELALIYGQDRTSDWAVAVSRDAARGARVQFEVFGSASAGFWGNWSHTLSACQRGPHRPQAPTRHHDAATSSARAGKCHNHNVDHVEPPHVCKQQHESRSWRHNIKTGAVNATFCFAAASSMHNHDDEPERGRSRSPPKRAHSITWSPEVHAPPDQTISIRRVTACASLGLGFLPARPKAAAEPRDPDVDRRKDHECAPIAAQSRPNASGDLFVNNHWCDDPLEALHEWIHEHGGTEIKVSIASDDDCLQLLSLLGDENMVAIGLQTAVRIAADRFACISVDDSGFAAVSIGNISNPAPRLARTLPTAWTRSLSKQNTTADNAVHRALESKLDRDNTDMDFFQADRRAPSVAGKTHRGCGAPKTHAMMSSRRFSTMPPCRPKHAFGSASQSLVIP